MGELLSVNLRFKSKTQSVNFLSMLQDVGALRDLKQVDSGWDEEGDNLCKACLIDGTTPESCTCWCPSLFLGRVRYELEDVTCLTL